MAVRKTKPKIAIDLAEVERLASLGLTREQISDCLGISQTTMYARLRQSAEFAAALKKGEAAGIAEVASQLRANAASGDTTAAIFFLKTRAGWNEKLLLEANVKTSVPEGLAEIYAKIGMRKGGKDGTK